MYFNQHILIGRPTANPTKEKLGEGDIAKFTIAVDRGGRHNETDFHYVTFFGYQAEKVLEYVKKGMLIIISGATHIDVVKDKTNRNRYYPHFQGFSFRILEKKEEPASAPAPLRAPQY